MTIERYSHVIHIVSNVRGKLAADQTPFDLFVSAFPAGTVSGAPKIRAMQIIGELEPQKRGLLRRRHRITSATTAIWTPAS